MKKPKIKQADIDGVLDMMGTMEILTVDEIKDFSSRQESPADKDPNNFIPGDEDCEKCDGEGSIRVVIRSADDGSPLEDTFQWCPDCGGTGKKPIRFKGQPTVQVKPNREIDFND